METGNTKSISELIAEAENKGLTVVIIGAGSEVGKHAAMVKMIENNPHKFMRVDFESLTESDKAKIEALEKKENPFEKPPIPFRNYAPEPLPNIDLTPDSYKTVHFAGNPKKKLKGWQKGKKR